MIEVEHVTNLYRRISRRYDHLVNKHATAAHALGT